MLSVSVPGDLPDILADKRAVKQMLLNLLSNAIKFTDPGRAGVGVRARRQARALPSRSRITASASAKPTCRGIGDPFFQARSGL